MSRYEFVMPPVRDWPSLWRANMSILTAITVGSFWRQFNSLRDDPPMKWPDEATRVDRAGTEVSHLHRVVAMLAVGTLLVIVAVLVAYSRYAWN